MSLTGRIILLPLMILVLLHSSQRVRCEEGASSEPDSSSGYMWGAVYTGLIGLREDASEFPWNDPAALSYQTDRVALMLDAKFSRRFHLFIKGTTGYRGREQDIYRSRVFLDQGHLSATWQDRVTGKLFLRERAFRNRNRLIFLVSNDSQLISGRGEGLDVAAMTAGSLSLNYSGAVFRDPWEQKENGGLPPGNIDGDYLNLFEGGIDRRSWHAGMTLAEVRSSRSSWCGAVLYGLDGGLDLAGGRLNLEFARSAREWDDLEDGLLGLDLDAMKWDGISAGLPPDGVLAVEWTGFSWNGGDRGRFGLTPGYRYSGTGFYDMIGEVPNGHVESYVEMWWKHARLASLVSVKAADRYDYGTGEGGGVLETSIWTRFRGGIETTARSFFAEGSRPVMIISVIDDNSLTRMLTTARIDDAGGRSEYSFLTEAGINLGRRWTLGGSVYLERSMEGFYSADIEMRGGRRFVFRASAGTYIPVSTHADLNHDPAPPATHRERTISFSTRIWLGGI